jgi:DNA-binding transcriptional MerR regulator/methylmalonyl-CoA mutase cobalamin-binding subunit
MDTTATYPIKVVSRQTGLSQHVIRAWEKRYGVVEPLRTDTNRRLYTSDDIHRLTLLKLAIDNDYNIGTVAAFSTDRLEELVSYSPVKRTRERLGSNPPEAEPRSYYEKCLQAVHDFNSAGLEDALIQASVTFSQPVLIEGVVMPLLSSIGELWRDGSIRIMQEHLSTAVISTFLTNQRQMHRPAKHAPAIIVATPQGQLHQVGALIVALVAATEGWKVVYLGADLPAEELAAACIQERARAIALSLVYPAEDPHLHQELERIENLLPEQTHLIIGGRVSKNYSALFKERSAWVGESLTEFRNYLQQIEISS